MCFCLYNHLVYDPRLVQEYNIILEPSNTFLIPPQNNEKIDFFINLTKDMIQYIKFINIDKLGLPIGNC